MSLTTIESYAKIIGVVVACFGVWTYYDTAQQAKVNKSLSYHDEFHSGRVFDARVEVGKLSYVWLEERRSGGESFTLDDFRNRALSDLSITPGVIYHDLIVEFFQRAHRCITVSGCDQDTLVRLLAEEAVGLQILLSPKIAERRESGDNSSDGLLCFATNYESASCYEG